MTGRQAARRALERWRRGGQFSEKALDAVISEGVTDRREAALCSRIVWCVIQNLSLIDHYIGEYSSVPMSKLEPNVLDILRLSAAQILFMDRVPPSAAVSSGVELCKTTCPRAAGLVNAVLRRIAEHRDALPPIPGEGTARYLSIKYSHPLWLAEKLICERGYDFTAAFFAANNAEPPLCAQVNTLRMDAAALKARLETRGVQVSDGALENTLLLSGAGRVTELPEFAEGLFYVQDEAARRAVLMAGLAPGMDLLDACAAPGGKSFAAALSMENRGRIIACDQSEKKLSQITDGADRLGVDIISVRQMDARSPDPDLCGWADAVIADCPCSGLGVIRKKPEIRYKPQSELAALPEIQLAILRGLADCVKPGGTLVYSTCTVLREENEDVAEAFLHERGDFTGADRALFWPHIHGTDGFFVCRMVRST